MVTFTIGNTPVHRNTSGTTLERKNVRLWVSQCVGKNSNYCMNVRPLPNGPAAR